MKGKFLKHSISISLIVSLVSGFCMGVFGNGGAGLGILFGVFGIYPFILTFFNLIFSFVRQNDSLIIRKSRHFEYVTIILGSIYSIMILPFTNIVFEDWQETLTNSQLHTPIWSQGAVTVLVCVAAGIAGCLFLSVVSLRKVPPLLSLCGLF